MNIDKYKQACDLSRQIRDLNTELDDWEGNNVTPPGNTLPPTSGNPLGVCGRYYSERLWLDFRARVIEELTTKRDALKQQFEAL